MARETRLDLRTDDNEVKVAETINSTNPRAAERAVDSYLDRAKQVVPTSVIREVVQEAYAANEEAAYRVMFEDTLKTVEEEARKEPNNKDFQDSLKAFKAEDGISKTRLDEVFNRLADNLAPEELAAYKAAVLNQHKNLGNDSGLVLPSPAILAPGNQLKP